MRQRRVERYDERQPSRRRGAWNQGMEGGQRKAGNEDEKGTLKALNPAPKIALVPFIQGNNLRVHLYGGDGKASSVRDRSTEDDFQAVVRSHAVAHTNEDVPIEGGHDEDRQPSKSSATHERPSIGGDASGVAEGIAVGSETKKEALSPPEHPLQKAITSLDMALGELNQLVHLVDLGRVGEFMVLERVTPTEEDQARANPDQSAGPGEGLPRRAFPVMMKLKRSQLEGAADQLRERARRLRETTKVQRVFQQGVVHLRKSWRIVAPNHGKVKMPLQVGEALSVDCSFGSAGGPSVPFTTAAGSRHRHPWLFQLTCGEGGRLKAQRSSTQLSKAFEVQLVSVVSGACEHSVRASFPGGGRWFGRMGNEQQLRETLSASNEAEVSESEGLSVAQMDQLEQHISRVQHIVFWEEVFETLKAEALNEGKDGWIAHQDQRFGEDFLTPEAVGKVEEGTKRRLVCLNPRGTTTTRNTAAHVAHVLDDEVMVEMDNQFLLAYKLVSGETSSFSSSGRQAATCLSADNSSSVKDSSRGPAWSQPESLCHLALLYCGSLIRQRQRDRLVAGRNHGSERRSGQEVGTWLPGPAGGKAGSGSTEVHLAAACTWKSVRRVLLHHVFRAEVVAVLAHVSSALQSIGLPSVVRWTHLEETCPYSALTLTLGHCFHFKASLDDGFGVVVSALPGLQNHADQRSVELRSAEDLQHFLLGEVCRQIVFTFGDIAAAWTSGIQPEGTTCFRVELVPAAIHLLPRPKAKNLRETPPEQTDEGSCEVRVFVEGVGVQIACSSWTNSRCTSNGRGFAKESQAGFPATSEATATWHTEFPSPVASAPGVSVAEWDRLEGVDLFRKFSSLLAVRYPL